MTNHNQNRICLIGTYFGKLPPFFDLWQKSCSYNPKVDFFVVTDQSFIPLSKNIKPLYMQFKDFKKMATEKLELEAALDYPYKCCDFKPVYGIILSDFVKEYDYWGHCDLDLIFGDIMGFLNKYHYTNYDKFLALGHFSLYKNTPEINSVYKKSGSRVGNYDAVFTSKKHAYFDELDGIYQIFQKHGYKVFYERIFADISAKWTRFKRSQKDPNYEQQIFYWEEGKAYMAYQSNGKITREEVLYIHFQKRHLPAPNFDYKKATAFYIGPTGFHIKNKDDSFEDAVQQYNPFRGQILEYYEQARAYVKRKFRSLKLKLKGMR